MHKVVPIENNVLSLEEGSVPWSCGVNNVCIVTSRDSSEPYEGPWKKELRLRIELETPLPVGTVPCGLPLESIEFIQHSSKPLLTIHHPVFHGLWNILIFAPDRRIVHCLVPKYETEKYEPNDYYVIVPSSGDQNLCVTRSPVEDYSKHIITIAPPLCFFARMTVFAIDEISTIGQTFRTSNFSELRLRSFTTEPDDELVDKILDVYGFHFSHIIIMDVVEHVSEQERYRSFVYHDKKFDVCFRMQSHVTLPEMFELQNFPFDSQDLTIIQSLNLPFPRAKLLVNKEAPSLFAEDSFRFKSEFDVTYGNQLHVKELCSDPSASAAGSIYSRLSFSLNLARKPGFCITNIVLPMAVLTSLTSISIGVKTIDGNRLDTGDRLSVTLTLLLTAVAFKLVMASNLPQVSYQTTLDIYILICNFWILLAALENVLYPSFGYDRSGKSDEDPKEKFDEWYVTIAYLASFILINVLFWWKVRRNLNQRNQMARTKYLKEENVREFHSQKSIQQLEQSSQSKDSQNKDIIVKSPL